MDFSKKISYKLWHDKIIEEDDIEIVQYGIQQISSLFLSILTLTIICLIYHTVFEGIIFLGLFWPLRIYAGGYHANTKLSCYVLTTLAEIVFFANINCSMNKIVILAMFLIAQTIILLLSPQDNENKKITKIEYRHYKRKVVSILIIQDIIFIITYFMNVKDIYITVAYLQLLMAVLLGFGIFKALRGKGGNSLLFNKIHSNQL